MLIGVISDTHDRTELTKVALALLRSLGIEALIHCGDLCNEAILDLLAAEQWGPDSAPPMPVAFVFGNNEQDLRSLARYGVALGLNCLGESGILSLGDKTVGITHGDHPRLIEELLTAEVDYLLTGHTHEATDSREGASRLVNPGAVHRTRVRSVATIDTATDTVTFHTF